MNGYGVSFFETMRGELVGDDGRAHAAEFEVKAEASRLSAFLRRGETRISGVIHAPPWATRAPLSGTLRIAPRARRIAYDFSFRGDAGAALRFVGRKDLSAAQPVRSMTELRGELRDERGTVARGALRFAVGELPAFLASFFPAAGFGTRSLRRPGSAGQLPLAELTAREEALLAAFVETVIAPGELAAEAAVSPARLRQALDEQLRFIPERLLRYYRLGLRALDLLAVARYRRPFASASLRQRRALLAQLGRGAGPPPLRDLQALVRYLAAPIKAVCFAHRAYLDQVGLPAEQPVAVEPLPRYRERVHLAEELDATTELQAEVVVVGTGAGGATVAKELAERGVAVALIEEGAYFGRQDFAAPPLERVRKLWRRAGMTFALGQPPISVPLGRGVGGTTTINSGTCLPAPDGVLRGWWQAGFPDEFLPQHFRRYYERVSAELDVQPGAQRYLGRVAAAVARGAEAMGLPHGALPRNAPDCDGQGSCIFGCPTGAKRSMDVSFIPRALKAGAELYSGLAARRLLLHQGRVVAVEARGCDRFGVEKTLRITADHVVLACGAIYTPVLLKDNGLRLPWLGRNLSLHPGMGMLALFDEPLAPWHAIPQGYGFGGFESEGICFEGFYLPPAFVAGLVPYVGPQLAAWMQRFDRVGQFGFMVRDSGAGSVHRDSHGRPLMRYALQREAQRRLQRGAAVLAEVLLRGGAREVLPGIGSRPPLYTVRAARRLGEARIRPAEYNLLGAHPLGTCRMGPRAAEAVVDFEHRVFGTENLYVVDGSVIPTALGANPQLTIMAFATRAAEILASRTA